MLIKYKLTGIPSLKKYYIFCANKLKKIIGLYFAKTLQILLNFPDRHLNEFKRRHSEHDCFFKRS